MDGVRKINSLHPSAPSRFRSPSDLGCVFPTFACRGGLGRVQAEPDQRMAALRGGLGPGIGLPCASVPSLLSLSLLNVICQLPLTVTEVSPTYIPVYCIFIMKIFIVY